jgi:hypothetical protein
LQIYFLKTEKLSLMYAEEVLDFPIQLIFRVSKKFELKKLYLKHFFFKKMVVKMPQHI